MERIPLRRTLGRYREIQELHTVRCVFWLEFRLCTMGSTAKRFLSPIPLKAAGFSSTTTKTTSEISRRIVVRCYPPSFGSAHASAPALSRFAERLKRMRTTRYQTFSSSSSSSSSGRIDGDDDGSYQRGPMRPPTSPRRSRSPYAVLGIATSATREDVKSSFRRVRCRGAFRRALLRPRNRASTPPSPLPSLLNPPPACAQNIKSL